MTTELTRAQMEILEFERATWRYLGRREAVIRERFGHSAVRHNQIVFHLIDQPAAEAYDPALVRRLKALRAKRATARSRGFEAAQ